MTFGDHRWTRTLPIGLPRLNEQEKWFSSSLALSTNVVAGIVDRLFSIIPFNLIALNVTTLVLCGPITHSSTRPKPDSCHLPCDIPTDIRLSACAWCSEPLFIIRHRCRMVVYPLETSHAFFNFSRCISLGLNSGSTLYPIPLDHPIGLTLYRSDPFRYFLLPYP